MYWRGSVCCGYARGVCLFLYLCTCLFPLPVACLLLLELWCMYELFNEGIEFFLEGRLLRGESTRIS